MSNTQYAVCHLQRGSGNDSGMSCHIERKDAKREKYVPINADANRTHLNRELVVFPAGVKNRTDAIQHRIDHARLHRKVGKNQTKAIRIILTGTHEQMMKIAKEGKLDNWINANLKWLKDTFESENLVSCVLHMDEKTPHIHAAVVPIVTGERRKAKKEQENGKRKYRKKSDTIRLCADDLFNRQTLIAYHDNYARVMAKYGLQRGVRGSEARHTSTTQYYRDMKKKNDALDMENKRLQEQKAEAEQELKRAKKEVQTEKLKGAATTAATNIAESVGSFLGVER